MTRIILLALSQYWLTKPHPIIDLAAQCRTVVNFFFRFLLQMEELAGSIIAPRWALFLPHPGWPLQLVVLVAAVARFRLG